MPWLTRLKIMRMMKRNETIQYTIKITYQDRLNHKESRMILEPKRYNEKEVSYFQISNKQKIQNSKGYSCHDIAESNFRR